MIVEVFGEALGLILESCWEPWAPFLEAKSKQKRPNSDQKSKLFWEGEKAVFQKLQGAFSGRAGGSREPRGRLLDGGKNLARRSEQEI